MIGKEALATMAKLRLFLLTFIKEFTSLELAEHEELLLSCIIRIVITSIEAYCEHFLGK